jgi:cytochrome c oxidase subunit III
MAHSAHGEHGFDVLKFQYEDIEQQNDSYIVGMWSFLVTEVMFFGALFMVYTLYRMNYLTDWWNAHKALDWKLGGANTLNLLISSFLMAVAVRSAQLKERKKVLALLAMVIGCAVIFMGIKYVEYTGKIQHGLYPGMGFLRDAELDEHLKGTGVNMDHAQLFFGLYFAMTGLHGVHVVVGILLIGYLMSLWYRKKEIVTEDYIPTELIGLYWHFVDIVWIFLYPLFYLMPGPKGNMGGGSH